MTLSSVMTALERSDVETSKAVTKAKKAAEKRIETVEEALIRIGAMTFTDKERAMYQSANDAHKRGQVVIDVHSRKLTKGDVLNVGADFLRKNEEVVKAERIRDLLSTKPPNFHVLTLDAELQAFLQRLETELDRQKTEWTGKFGILGVETMTANDFEGTGIDAYIDVSIGYSVWLPLLDEGYYLAYGHVDMRGVDGFDFLDDKTAFKSSDPQLTRSAVLSAISPYLSDASHGKTFHMGSARYDLHIAINDGYEIRGCRWDTLDAMTTLNEHEEAYGLKPLIAKYGHYFGVKGPVYTFEDLFGKRSPAPFNTEIVGIYAIKDVLYGWKLFEWQLNAMRNAPGRLLDLYATIDSRLPETDVFLCRCGFEIDLVEMKRLETEFGVKVEQSKKDVMSTYKIDESFIDAMSRCIHGEKIDKWIETQRARIERRDGQIAKLSAIIDDCERSGKTSLAKYRDAVERTKRYESEVYDEPIAKNAPDYIRTFEFTNGNHLAYLIYDHLGIEDVTPRIKRGKTRSTAADVLDVYYEEEPALEPLATVATYEKLLNTYAAKIPFALEVDGRLHSEFKAGGTSTGRYSSSGYKGRPIDILDEFKTAVTA